LISGIFAAVTTTLLTAYADRDYKKDKDDKKDMKDHNDGYDKDSSDVSKTITKEKLKQKMLVVEIQTIPTVDKTQLTA